MKWVLGLYTFRLSVIVISALIYTGAAIAGTEPLSADGLAHCANQAFTLRQESVRLNQINVRLDSERSVINQRTESLRAEEATGESNQLKDGLDLHERRLQNNAAADSFNAQIEQLRRDIAAINSVKHDYDQSCSNRPYHRRDLTALPEPLQQAMRQGLGDIQVPYIEGASAVSTPWRNP